MLAEILADPGRLVQLVGVGLGLILGGAGLVWLRAHLRRRRERKIVELEARLEGLKVTNRHGGRRINVRERLARARELERQIRELKR